MYAFLIVPQRKRQRAHAELLRSIGPGDEVLTSGGIYGGVTEMDGDDLYLEIAPDVEIKISRRAVAERIARPPAPRCRPRRRGGGRRRRGADAGERRQRTWRSRARGRRTAEGLAEEVAAR